MRPVVEIAFVVAERKQWSLPMDHNLSLVARRSLLAVLRFTEIYLFHVHPETDNKCNHELRFAKYLKFVHLLSLTWT